MKRPGRWMWRSDRLSHLVNMDADQTLALCGLRAPFNTSGAEDFDACKRCLRSLRAGTVEVTPYPPRPSHLELARGS